MENVADMAHGAHKLPNFVGSNSIANQVIWAAPDPLVAKKRACMSAPQGLVHYSSMHQFLGLTLFPAPNKG